MAGQDYEVGLCSLLLLRGQRLCSQFFLACNHRGAGLFDDAVFVYRHGKTDVSWRAILVQLKHKENCSLTLSKVKGKGFKTLDLEKYCKSFVVVKDKWRCFQTDETSTVDLEKVTYVFYSNSMVDLHGADRDVPTGDITELIVTGGRAVKIDYGEVSQEVWGQQLPNSREFVENFVVCCNQIDHEGMEKKLEEEVKMCLNSQSVDTLAIVTEVTKFIKKWWEKKFDVPYMTEDSDIWQIVVNKEIMRLNTNIGSLSSKLNLLFTLSQRDDVASCVKASRQMCLLVRDETHASMTSIMLYQAVKKSLVLDNETLEQDLGEVLVLWQTSYCQVLVVDASLCLQEGTLHELVAALAIRADKKLVVISGERPVGNGWEVHEVPKTWEVLDDASKDRLLSVHVTLQGLPVALKELIGGSAGDVMSDVHIETLAEKPSGIVLGKIIPPVPEDYLPRCIERNVIKESSFIDSLKNKRVIVAIRGIGKEEARRRFRRDFIISHYSDVTRQRVIAAPTIVTGDIPTSLLSELSSRFKCQGYFIHIDLELPQYEVTEMMPCPWLSSEKIVLVDGFPGIGKSSFVTWMCTQVKDTFPEAWVLRVDMGKESDFIKERDFEKEQVVKEFLMKGCLSLECCSLERELVNHALDVTGNVFIFLDAFDEISPTYTQKCCRLLKNIAESVKYRQFVVTTRPVTKRDVEDTLVSVAFHLPCFTESEQRSFLRSYCKTKGMDTDYWYLIRRVGPVLEVPLLCKMAAELLLGNKAAVDSLTKVALYTEFVDRQVALYLTEKFGLKSSMAGVEQLLKNQSRYLTGQLKDLAVTTLLSSEERDSVRFQTEGDSLQDNKLGLLVCSSEGVDFVHRTFAEYFLGAWLAEHYRDCKHFLRARLYQENYELVTDSFNWFLAKGNPLQSAVVAGDLPAVEHLMDSVTSLGPGGRSLLHVAALSSKNNAVMWRKLVDNGVLLELEDDVLEWTAMEYAQELKDWDMVDFLLGEGASSSKLRTVKNMESARKILSECTRKGLVNISLLIIGLHHILLSKSLIDDDDDDVAETTALHLAVTSGSNSLVSELLSLGSEVNASNSFEETALHRASYYGRPDTVTLLLEHGADITRADNNLHTALHWASTAGWTDTVALLLEHGDDITRVDKDGHTALHLASRAGRTDTVALLLKHGADITGVDNNLHTALHWACAAGWTHTVALLLEHGADITRINKDGHTALHLASMEGRKDTVSLLLEHGAKW